MSQIITPETPEQFADYFHLRWRVLREPFQRPLGSEQDEYDQLSHHRMLVDDDGKVLAVGRLHFNSPEEAQIRYMAVDPDERGQGHGVAIIFALETAARQEGAQQIVINSRKETLGFYEKCGYQLNDDSAAVGGPQAEYQLRKTFSEVNRIIYRPEWCAELQNEWQQKIPISDAMAIKIHQYTGRVFETRAQLSRNINVHNTMFAGSIYSQATLTCWGLLHLQLQERGLPGSIVLADGQIKYRKPVTEDPRALAKLADIQGDFSDLEQGQNAHLLIRAEVLSEERPVAEFTGRFVVLAPRD
ncbi:GNAT family N-acetyltransferase [Idiomarina tyrosinivorans]|uniref:GNAT family N-acetyltransferase n=1 Tax=Idiomarina tyrosinivorans TaxID=1445662 RepID=A0A432ZPX9_9GAMM|nr:bifunctional GNAT family N-acetyltransferase/hotdog fold thioesterase [Idiomarina tyrosinivorans]RUO79933.1 GNAT family N-acetyltransferase [Idiomarina tyrosinivorans]